MTDHDRIEWAVQLTYSPACPAEQLLKVEDEFADAGLDASVSRASRVDQWMLTVSAEALTGPDALQHVLGYADEFGVPGLLLGFEVLAHPEYERRAVEPTMPVLLGASEVADVLNVTRQRVHQLRANAAFPEPLVEVAMGPLWDEEAVLKFARDWDRKPGRPRLVAAEPAPK